MRGLLIVVALAGVPSVAISQSAIPLGRTPGERLEEMVMQLDLDEAQRAQVRQIVAATREEAQPLRLDLRAAKRALERELMGTSAEPEPLKARAGAVSKAEAALREHHAATLARVREVLTPDQRAEFQRIRSTRTNFTHGVCREEITRLCPNARRPGDRMRCGLANRDELSRECRETLEARAPHAATQRAE